MDQLTSVCRHLHVIVVRLTGSQICQLRSVIAKVTDCAMEWYREPGLERDTLATDVKVGGEKEKTNMS